MDFSVTTWNINSVRLRIDLVGRYLAEKAPDVLCLQETKCPDANFPHGAFRAAGYPHIAISGQKGYHGVAIVSRVPFASHSVRDFCKKGDARHLRVILDGPLKDVELHNFYVPAGGDEPDPAINPKFAHKLAFVDEMAEWAASDKAAAGRAILVGDLNIAPLEHDVWSHKALINVVSHTPVEVREAGARSSRRPVGRRAAQVRARIGKALHVVELPLARLGQRRQGTAARPRLGQSGIRGRRRRHGGHARGPRLGPPLRPRSGEGDAVALASTLSCPRTRASMPASAAIRRMRRRQGSGSPLSRG